MSVLRGASPYCSEPVCAEDAEGEDGDVCYFRGATQSGTAVNSGFLYPLPVVQDEV